MSGSVLTLSGTLYDRRLQKARAQHNFESERLFDDGKDAFDHSDMGAAVAALEACAALEWDDAEFKQKLKPLLAAAEKAHGDSDAMFKQAQQSLTDGQMAFAVKDYDRAITSYEAG